MPRARRLVALGAVVWILLWLSQPLMAQAHAILLASYPANGDVLAVPPHLVQLWFSEPVEVASGGVEVFSPTGQRVERGRIASNGIMVSVTVRITERGTYAVVWRAISADTHISYGRYTFSVGRPGGNSAGAQQTGATLGLWLQIAARWLHLLGVALAVGAACVYLAVARPVLGAAVDGWARQLWRLVSIGLVALIVSEPIGVAAQALTLGGGSIDITLAGVVLASNDGRVIAQRLAIALLLWVAVPFAVNGARWAAWAIAALGAVIAVVDTGASHVVRPIAPLLSIATVAMHEVAAAAWVGGLIALSVMLRLTPDGRLRWALIGRIAVLASLAVAMLAGTGVALALAHLNSPLNLLDRGYGTALAIKVGVIAVALCMAMATRARIAQRQRWLLAETTLLVGAIGLASVMASLPPPR